MQLDRIQSDFDQIARISRSLPDSLGPHEAELLTEVPRGDSALDIGCGIGTVVRTIAPWFDRVVGIDLSPEMVAEARRRTAMPRVEYFVAEAVEWLKRRPAAYDCITSMAVLHHMDLERVVSAIKDALKPGGTFIAVDITTRPGVRHLPLNAIALVASRTYNFVANRSSAEMRRAYEAHGRDETYLTPNAARELFGTLLPGARVRSHLMWRYSVLWRK